MPKGYGPWKSDSLSKLADVLLTALQSGDELVWNEVQRRWINVAANVFNSIILNETTVADHVPGRLTYDGSDLNFESHIAGVVQQIGKELWVDCVNKESDTMLNGTVAYMLGSTGSKPRVYRASNDDEDKAHSTIGVATHDAVKNADVELTTFGLVHDFNTSAWEEGDRLWLSTNGLITNVKPVSPAHKVKIGHCIYKNANHGIILVNIQYGTELKEMDDVLFANLADRDMLIYDLTSTLWKNLPEPFHTKHGFENQTDSEWEIDGTTFKIRPTGDSFSFWVNGRKITKTEEETIEISYNQKQNYITYNASGVLGIVDSAWSIQDLTAIPVHLAYRNGSLVEPGDERHGYLRNLPWHVWAHTTIGARYRSGFTGVFGNSSFSIAQGIIADEDLQFDSGETKTDASLWYRDTGGTYMAFEQAISTPYKVTTGVPYYDNNGTLTAVTNNHYFNTWFYASNNREITMVVGQSQHQLLTSARNASYPTFNGFSTLEWKLLYRVTYQYKSGSITYIEEADLRNQQSGPAAAQTPSTHAALIGRDALNSHPATAISPIIVSDIDGKTVAQTNLLTVPTGTKGDAWAVTVGVQAASAITDTCTIQVGTSADPDAFIAPADGKLDASMITAGKKQRFDFQSDELSAGDIVQIGITDAATGTSITLRAILHAVVYSV